MLYNGTMKKLKLKDTFTPGTKKLYLDNGNPILVEELPIEKSFAYEVPNETDLYYTDGLVLDYTRLVYWNTTSGTNLTDKLYYDGDFKEISGLEEVEPWRYFSLGLYDAKHTVVRDGVFYSAMLSSQGLAAYKDGTFLWETPLLKVNESNPVIEFLQDYILVGFRYRPISDYFFGLRLLDYDGNEIAENLSVFGPTVSSNDPRADMFERYSDSEVYFALRGPATGYTVDTAGGALNVTSGVSMLNEFAGYNTQFFHQDESFVYNIEPFGPVTKYSKVDFSTVSISDIDGITTGFVNYYSGNLIVLLYYGTIDGVTYDPDSRPRILEVDPTDWTIVNNIVDPGAIVDDNNLANYATLLNESTLVYIIDRSIDDSSEIVWFDLDTWTTIKRETVPYHNGGMVLHMPISFKNDYVVYYFQYDAVSAIDPVLVIIDADGHTIYTPPAGYNIDIGKSLFAGEEGVYAYASTPTDYALIKL